MKSNYLFIDSSLYIQVGLLSDDLKWLHYEYVPNQQGSTVLHSIIFNILKDFSLKILDLKGVIIANGPGSYTGIRLTEGIAQILEGEGLAICSFYHFEVPFLSNIYCYRFYANAFKGEVFEYKREHSGDVVSSILSKKDFLNLNFDKNNLFGISSDLHDQYLESSIDLIKSNPVEIFSKVLDLNRHLEPYYFRSLEKEFKPSFNE